MADKYSRSVMRVVTAQLSQAVGFDSIQSSSLDVLTDIFERYLQALGKTVHDFSEQRGQTWPNLGDVEFAFKHLHVPLYDIVDYTQQMEPVVFPHKVGVFPAPKVSNLQFPSGNNPEDFERGEHIPLYMPSMIQAPPQTSSQDVENNSTAVGEGQQGKKATFVIAGKHSKGSSSDEDDYSAGELSNEEYMSDDSLAHNPTKSRHLTKPEDIPMIEGTAPSSLMTMPSSELDELQGSLSPRRRSSIENMDEHHEKVTKKPSKTPQLTRPFPIKWQTDNRASEKISSGDPKWLSDRKKSQDVYDADWLHGGGGASPVHLSKPPTPDATFGSPSLEKRPWHAKSQNFAGDEMPKSSSKKDTKQITMKHHSTPNIPTSQKHTSKLNVERKSSQPKPFKPSFKHTPSFKKENLNDEPIKARIEAAERLIHSPPVPGYKPTSPRSIKHKPSLQPTQKSPIRSSIERAEKLLKHPPVEDLKFPSSRESSPAPKHGKVPDKFLQDKADRSNFASSKSMYDAIDAVINRASDEIAKKDEEAKKQAEEAELMKFSHLVEDSSSSDSEVDVSHKVEQMLQLEERGLRDAQPPTPGSSPMPTPSSSPSLGIDEDEDVVVDSDSDDSIKLPPKKSYDFSSDIAKPKIKQEKHSKKEKHKKKMKKISSDMLEGKSSQKSHSSMKVKKEKQTPKPASFVTTETISEKPVKMKVKLKHFEHSEPKLFDVESDRDRVRITETKHTSKPSKDEKHKSKDGKHHKTKEHKKHATPKLAESKQSSGEHDMSVEKIILKKSKSGDAKVVKPKIKEYTRSPSPPSPIRSNLPLPKLSAAVPVMTAISKEKKKSKKEKKKKKEREREFDKDWMEEKERHSEKVRKESKDKSHKDKYKDINWESKSSSRRESFDSDVSSPLVPKLTLKMGASEKKFVIKQPPAANQKSGGKKRSLSSMADSPIPAKDRKVSVESVKTVSEGFAAAVERKVITQTISAGPVGVYEDEDGNKVWICPGCNKPDDGSPMIGCDTCDDWYHWPCVNITKEPPDDVDWYCPRCIKIQQQSKLKASGKKRKKK